MVKKSFSVYGKQQYTKIMNLTDTPTHLDCDIHLIANFLSFHMSLVVVMHFGAGNALHGIEIIMFWFY